MPRWHTGREVARPAYYDREAFAWFMYSIFGDAPHATTTRATYTPPVGWAAFIEVFTFQVYRTNAAAAVGDVALYANFLPYYGGSHRFAYVTFRSNNLMEKHDHNASNFGYLAYGDEMEAISSDASTTGACIYLVSVKMTEFLYR